MGGSSTLWDSLTVEIKQQAQSDPLRYIAALLALDHAQETGRAVLFVARTVCLRRVRAQHLVGRGYFRSIDCAARGDRGDRPKGAQHFPATDADAPDT
jgi:hypothetical protein